MNREIPQGNKIIYQKMYRKERQRQMQRLQAIRSRPTSLHIPQVPFFRHTALLDSEKNLEIQRNNIALFNKIASIIKEKPKIEIAKSRSHVQSLDQALYKHEKKRQELRMQNSNFLKRLTNLQPTIRNQEIYKDRARNERYLSFIGRYPMKPHKRNQTQYQIAKDQQEFVFHQKSLDFDIGIIHRPQTDEYQFVILDIIGQKEHRMRMEGNRFKQQLALCQLNYQKLIGRLRMDKNGQIIFTQPLQTQKSERNLER